MKQSGAPLGLKYDQIDVRPFHIDKKEKKKQMKKSAKILRNDPRPQVDSDDKNI